MLLWPWGEPSFEGLSFRWYKHPLYEAVEKGSSQSQGLLAAGCEERRMKA